MADTSEEPEQEYVQLKLPSRGGDEEGTVILLPADMADKFIGNCELNVTEGASGSKVIELTTGMLEDDDEEPQRKKQRVKGKKNAASNRNGAAGGGEHPALSRVISDDLGKKLMFWRFVENLAMNDIMANILKDDSIPVKPARRTIYNFYEKVTGGTGGNSQKNKEAAPVVDMKAIGRSQPYFQMQMEAQYARDKQKQKSADAKQGGKHKAFINEDMGRKLFYWRFVENIPMIEIMKRIDADPIFPKENRPKRRTVYQWFNKVTGQSNPMSTARKRPAGKNPEREDQLVIPAANRSEIRQTLNDSGLEVDRMNELESNDLARSLANLAASQKRTIDQLQKETRNLKSSLIKLQHIFSTEFDSLEKQGIMLPSLNRMLETSHSGKKMSKAAAKAAAAAASSSTQNDLLGREDEDDMEDGVGENGEDDEDELYNGGSLLEDGEDDDGNDIHFTLND